MLFVMPWFVQANVQTIYTKIDSLLPFAQNTLSKALLNKYNYDQAASSESQTKFLEKRSKAVERLKELLQYAESLEVALESQKRRLNYDYFALKNNLSAAKNSIKSMITIAQE